MAKNITRRQKAVNSRNKMIALQLTLMAGFGVCIHIGAYHLAVAAGMLCFAALLAATCAQLSVQHSDRR
jgi:hypothetical protein